MRATERGYRRTTSRVTGRWESVYRFHPEDKWHFGALHFTRIGAERAAAAETRREQSEAPVERV